MRTTENRLPGRAFRIALIFLLVWTAVQWTVSAPKAHAAANAKIIVGYWHNFDNGSTNIRLRDVSPDFDVIQVAFAEPVGGATTGNMSFTPYNATTAEFKSDIAYLQSQGKKVLISIGGANGTVDLETAQARQTFAATMRSLIDTYGFNGIDIDLEGSSLSLNGGDTDFKNPTTPKIVNLIGGIRDILGAYGSEFLLTMAPETAYVQGGYIAYGGPWGAYLPVIYNLRNELDYLHVQHYNSGSMTALDGKSYAQGTADFHAAMADMLLSGFPVNNNSANVFPALRPDQVLIGLPASPQAASGGFTTVANVQKALDYLIKGQSFGGGYVLRNPGGYPGMKGLMTWSINWDKYNNFEFSRNHRAYLNQYNGGGGDMNPPSIPGNLRSTGKTSNSVSLAWDASTDNVGVTGYTVSYGSGSVNVSGTSATITGLAANTAYTFTVKARDAAGNVSGASSPLTVTTDSGAADTTPPSTPTNLQSTGKTSNSVTLSWSASTDNVGVSGYTVSYGSTSVNVTGTSTTVSGLSANTAYTFTVKAYDAAGNVSTASAPLTVTTNPPATGCTDPAWNASTAYVGGQRVSYNGNTYEAKWWTQGEQPDLKSGPYDVWKLIGACGGGGGDTTAPTTPANLRSTGKTDKTVSLAWDASTDNVGVMGYTVTYGSTSVNVTGTSTTISGLSPNTSYSFTVKARDAAGNVSSASSPLSVTTTATSDTTPPSAPTNLAVTGKSSSSVNLSWSASTDNVGVTGYTVTYGSSSVNVAGTSASITGLAAGTAYTFTVTARDAAGNVSAGASIQATTDPGSGANAWAPNVAYKVNDLVTYGGKTYKCQQAHTSQVGWEPPNVPALWILQ